MGLVFNSNRVHAWWVLIGLGALCSKAMETARPHHPFGIVASKCSTVFSFQCVVSGPHACLHASRVGYILCAA